MVMNHWLAYMGRRPWTPSRVEMPRHPPGAAPSRRAIELEQALLHQGQTHLRKAESRQRARAWVRKGRGRGREGGRGEGGREQVQGDTHQEVRRGERDGGS